MRTSTADMLSDLGFDVIEARSAEEALKVIGSGRPLELVVTDHLMAGMTGTELAREAQELRPGLLVLIRSGYAEVDAIAPHLPRLTEPFRQPDLAASLAAISGSGGACRRRQVSRWSFANLPCRASGESRVCCLR